MPNIQHQTPIIFWYLAGVFLGFNLVLFSMKEKLSNVTTVVGISPFFVLDDSILFLFLDNSVSFLFLEDSLSVLTSEAQLVNGNFLQSQADGHDFPVSFKDPLHSALACLHTRLHGNIEPFIFARHGGK